MNPVLASADKFRLIARIKNNLSELIRLSIPIIVARAGIMLMITVDIVMVGHFSSRELAYQTIGLSLVMPMLVTGLGLLIGTQVICANRFGSGDLDACGRAWRNSLPFAFCLGLTGIAFTLFGEPLLLVLGQTPDLAGNGGRVMMITGYGLPAFFLILTTEFFLEGIKRPWPPMFVLLAANCLNIALNWALIFGNLGLPELGAVGAAWATTASRWFAALSLCAYVWTMRDHTSFAVRIRPRGGWRSWEQQRRIGYATSISIGGESFSFAALNIFAGWLGPLTLAAYSISFNLLTMVFMVALGLGAATAVRIGVAHGNEDHADITLAGWTGLGANTTAMVFFGLVFFFAAEPIAGLFSNDPVLISMGAPLVAFAAYVLVVDGGQAVMANALRGLQDDWIPCGIQVFNYIGVMVPVAYFLVFPGGQGGIGLLQGILIGSCVSIVLLAWRCHSLGRRPRPIHRRQCA